VLASNLAYNGGGAYSGTLTNCTLTGNSASYGGGAYSGTLANCILTGNSASYGGGAYSSTLANSALTANSATCAGGAYSGTLVNCTLTGNSASAGGGAYYSTLDNCLVYFNCASSDANSANYTGGSLNYCCATPLPASGTGNLATDPQLASPSHLSAGSPCRGAGSASYVTGTDIDGERWANPPSIGCDEFYFGASTEVLSLSIQAAYTNVAAGFSVDFVGNITGRVSASAWDFGDGTVTSNRPYCSHAWVAPGDYTVTLRAYNGTYPGGVSVTTRVQVVTQPVLHVALTSASPMPPYAGWLTAARSIQDAVDAATTPGTIVLVSNGVYASGTRVVYGAMANRVVVTNPVTVQSVNGAAATIIQGYQVPGATNGDSAVRCVYLGNGASLVGFTLTQGATRAAGDWYAEKSGGAVWCASCSALVSNCVIAGNSAYYDGGGAAYGTIDNCALSNNWAGYYGGGDYSSTLANCTLTDNSAYIEGGGAYGGTLVNCTLKGNSAPSYGGGASSCTLINCLLTSNSCPEAAGAHACTLANCTVTSNNGTGISYCTANNCIVTSNSSVGTDNGTLNNCVVAWNLDGGTFYATLNNCTVVGNSSSRVGGAYGGTLNNCIVYYNTAPSEPNYIGATFNNCCTTPMPQQGTGNFAAAPLLVDLASGNFRLQPGSPCINVGNNAYVNTTADLDGRPRIVGGTVDVGAYEFQPGICGAFIAWLQQYGLPTDGSADYADFDHDGMNNWQEWIAGTDPTNSASCLKMLPPALTTTNAALAWTSVTNRSYFLQRATLLNGKQVFTTLQTNIPGQASTTSAVDTNATATGPAFYRVGVVQ
jgi:hypothetical protein